MLDITRLIRRAGRRATGVDRVELAYLTYLLREPEPLFALARTTLGYVLLGMEGAQAILDRATGETSWGRPDRLSLATRHKSENVRRAESDLRRLAIARCLPQRLKRMLTQHLPKGVAYLNTGHSNLTERVFWSLRHGPKASVAVLVHDTIPLDFPHYQRPGTKEKFRAFLRRAWDADLLIFNSRHSEAQARAHMADAGQMPRAVVAHLGVTPMHPDPSDLPADLPPAEPYFVALGTIEPRKRHDLLLDVWEDMRNGGADVPGLLICGTRGWNNKAVFDRLDQLPVDSPVRELPGLSDGAIAALLSGSCGLLFPSEAEGFGLPPIEAAALNVPVMCMDLPAYHEVLGDIPVYLKETDRYLWRNSIESLLKGQEQINRTDRPSDFTPPAWEAHFRTVLSLT